MSNALSALFYMHTVSIYIYIFIYVVFYVCDYFYTFGLIECENKLQLPEPNNVLTKQCVQDPKVRIQYFKYYGTLKRTS